MATVGVKGLTIRSYGDDIFYRSDDPSNGVTALKKCGWSSR